jgi:hypothetical protein
MKMTFEVPDPIGCNFRRAVPAGKRSSVIARYMEQEVRQQDQAIVDACRQANQLKTVERQNQAWERFDDNDNDTDPRPARPEGHADRRRQSGR